MTRIMICVHRDGEKMTEGICPISDCHNDEPAIVGYGNNLWCVSCKKCGGFMTFYICSEEDAYIKGIELWMEVTGHSSDDE